MAKMASSEKITGFFPQSFAGDLIDFLTGGKPNSKNSESFM